MSTKKYMNGNIWIQIELQILLKKMYSWLGWKGWSINQSKMQSAMEMDLIMS